MAEVKRIEAMQVTPLVVLEITPGWYLTRSDFQFSRQENEVEITSDPIRADDLNRMDPQAVEQVLRQFPHARRRQFRLQTRLIPADSGGGSPE